MAIRRTQKKDASNTVRLSQLQYSYRAPSEDKEVAAKTTSKTSSKSAVRSSGNSISDLFSYDVKLIYNDLIKTAIITAAMIVILIGITLYLKR